MKRILFVDDDERMLYIYKALLSDKNEHWEVATAANGVQALKLMEQCPFDMVASDMRMEGMNGIELLNTVLKLYPQTSRMIISGVADQAAAAEALGSVHQFLVKPVEFNTLRAALVRMDGLDAFLNDAKLKALAGRLRTLPSFPTLYLEIMKAVQSPDTPLQTIDDLIIRHPALTTKILQVANSAAIGLREKINDPLEAVQQLGLDTVRSLTLSAHVFASFTPAQKLNFPVDALWNHLMACGNAARVIMRTEDADNSYVESAYTAGILHDIGKLMLADSLPNEFQNVLTQAMTRTEPFHLIEQEVFGATHAGLAAYLLGLWGLPAMITEAVAFHHTPKKSAHEKFSPLTAVHVANALEHEMDGGDSRLDQEYLENLGVTNRLDIWRKEIGRSKTE